MRATQQSKGGNQRKKCYSQLLFVTKHLYCVHTAFARKELRPGFQRHPAPRNANGLQWHQGTAFNLCALSHSLGKRTYLTQQSQHCKQALCVLDLLLRERCLQECTSPHARGGVAPPATACTLLGCTTDTTDIDT